MKKRIFLALALVAMIVFAFAITASAASYVADDGIKYSTNSNGTAYVADSRSTFSGEEAIILEKVTIEGKEYTVTSIGTDAFYGEAQLKTIYFPPTITEIGSNTFCAAKGIQSIYIRFENLVSIGSCGLTTCSNANSDTNTIKTINFYDPSEYGKENPTATETANFKSITSIGAAAVQGLNVKELILGENLTSISKQCFRHSTIEALTIESTNITTFYHYSFNSCANLKTIVIKSAPTKVENDFFSSCTKVESITMDLSRCTFVGGSAFEFSTGCQNGGVYNNITQWYNLEGKKLVDLSSIEILEKESFGTSNIGSAEIIWPNGMTSLGQQAFRKANLKGTVYIRAKENTTLSLETYAFGGNSGIDTAIFGQGVNKISENMFAEIANDGMTVVFLDTVEYKYGSNIFGSCKNVTIYYKEFTGTQKFSNSTLIPITAGTATNYGVCGIYASVTTADGVVVFDKTTHNFALVGYDNTYCPINTMGNYECSKCEAEKQVANEGTAPVKDGHAFNTLKNIAYANNFINAGEKITVCSCGLENVESVNALFVFLGYSTREEGTAICASYTINTKELNAYKEFNKSFKFGAVGSSKTENILSYEDGEIKAGEKTVVAPVEGEYIAFDFVISGFASSQADLALVIGAYAYDGESIVYLFGNDGAPSTITLNQVIEQEMN